MRARRSWRQPSASQRRIGAAYVVGTGFFLAAMLATLWAGIQLQPYMRVFGR